MSKLDEILNDTRREAVWFSKNKYSRTPNGSDIGTVQPVAKEKIKKLILDTFKEAEYEPYKFVEKIEEL